MPRLNNIHHLSQDCKIFSTIDLVRDYNSIPVALENIYLRAITTPFGLLEFSIVPFGLLHAAQNFNSMNQVLRVLNLIFVNIDDNE